MGKDKEAQIKSKFNPSPFNPACIHSQLGPVTCRLTDGSTWHVSRLVHVQDPLVEQDTNPNLLIGDNASSPTTQPQHVEAWTTTPTSMNWKVVLGHTKNFPGHLTDHYSLFLL